MFVRNWYKARAAEMANKYTEILGSESNYPKLVSVDGTTPSQKYNGNYQSAQSYVSWINAMKYAKFDCDVSAPIEQTSSSRPFDCRTFFGSGTTTPTIDDYRLEGAIAMNCTESHVVETSYAEDGTSATRKITYTITNNNDEPITIGEIGIFVCACWCTGYYKYTSYPYLYERTVLESPITIPAGGVGQVTYSITENYLEP